MPHRRVILRAKRQLWSLFFLILEALLGAALVLKGWVENNTSTARIVAQSVHFSNTMLLLATTTAVAVLLGTNVRPVEAEQASSDLPHC